MGAAFFPMVGDHVTDTRSGASGVVVDVWPGLVTIKADDHPPGTTIRCRSADVRPRRRYQRPVPPALAAEFFGDVPRELCGAPVLPVYNSASGGFDFIAAACEDE